MIVIDVAGRAKFDPDRMGKATLALGDRLFAGLNAFEAGQRQRPHVHRGQDKLCYVLAGRAEVRVGDEHGLVGPGDLVLFPAGVEHSLHNPGPERLLAMIILAPPREGDPAD
ncbi:MAG TPA: cupin domain-containing protein [Candidatus Polarisedimenticolaceae bacterium]|nr:cupin domain-containing protein [Candidatus Polarisedimenticolaceae bacterium]